MSKVQATNVAIIDYGMGNLFSVSQACEKVGMAAYITASPREVQEADAVILPGVGAFGDAMESLAKMDLISVLLDFADSPKPLIGVCLGMQLLMTEGNEFGRHQGLGIVEGEVVRLETSNSSGPNFKVPQVGWNKIFQSVQHKDENSPSGACDTCYILSYVAPMARQGRTRRRGPVRLPTAPTVAHYSPPLGN